MIIVKLQGGLGNQLFQYAMGRALADRSGQELLLDLQFLQDRAPRENFTFRNFALDHFSVRAGIAEPGQLRRIAAYPGNKWERVKKNFLNLTGRVHYIYERDFGFQPIKIATGRVNYISGFWQSELYFKAESGAIRNDLRLHNRPDARNQVYLKTIRACTAVSLHIRRGDYVANMTHPVCDLSYYARAVDLFKDRFADPVFFVFTDDINWVNEHFRVDGLMQVIEGNEGQSHLDLFLMSQCQHHITANSTFSWWGAWLGNHPQKIVISPQNWFSSPEVNVKTLLPEQWITI